MALTSADVNNQSFTIDRKGYNVDEVDVFLEKVSAELDHLNSQIMKLRDQLSNGRSSAAPSDSGNASASEDVAKRDARIKELEAQVEDRRADDSAIAQALIIAQRSADEIVDGAHETADKTCQDAEDEAQRILDKANAEKQRILDEIKKLEESREQSRDKYSDMLNDFIASSKDVLDDLTAGKEAGKKKNGRGSHSSLVHRDTYKSQYSTPKNQDEPMTGVVTDSSSKSQSYTTPTVSPVAVAPMTPTPSKVEKDFSGFGDADSGFAFDDVD
jgi:DivIVA domain-containing protein